MFWALPPFQMVNNFDIENFFMFYRMVVEKTKAKPPFTPIPTVDLKEAKSSSFLAGP